MLIDVPHLVAQMPFLLGEKANDLDHWNKVAMHKDAPFGLDRHCLIHISAQRALTIGCGLRHRAFGGRPLSLTTRSLNVFSKQRAIGRMLYFARTFPSSYMCWDAVK